MRPYGQKRVGYGDDDKMGRAQEKEAIKEALEDAPPRCRCGMNVGACPKHDEKYQPAPRSTSAKP